MGRTLHYSRERWGGGMVAPTSGVGSNKVYDSKAKVHNKKNVKEKERKPVGGSIHQR